MPIFVNATTRPMHKWLSLILAMLMVCRASSQELYDDYRLYKLSADDEQEHVISGDTLLFYRLQQNPTDIFDDVTAYRFSFVEYARRGQFYQDRKALVDGVELRHQNLAMLRRVVIGEQSFAGLGFGSGQIGSLGSGMELYSTHQAVPIDGANVGLFFSGKGYLGGARATAHVSHRGGWSSSLHTTLKGGNDLYVKGVYNNSLDLALRLSKHYESGASLSLVALATLSDRGLRSGTTEEAFRLTGNKLYNPTWGKQSGKVRNSRTRQDCVPFAMLSYHQPLGESTQMSLSVAGDYGTRDYTSLGWYGAMTPRPDNYRYLPSYYGSVGIASEIEKAWRAGDERYTQVDWQELYAQNRMSNQGAIYALEGHVERIAKAQASLYFITTLSQNLTLDYGFKLTANDSRNFKQMKDLLGALYLRDVDYYLMDDDTYSLNYQNDLRNPNRKVQEGDRFSYDYSLTDYLLSADLILHYRSNRWLWDVGLSVADERISRRGYFEKEIYSGQGSYGSSATAKFTPYTFKTTLGYSFSPKHYLNLGVALSDVAPEAKDIFLNPQYNNRLVDNPEAEHHFGAEATYRFTSQNAQFVVTAYMLSKRNQRQTFRAYDDLSATYCDVVVEGIGELSYGVESAGKLTLSRSLELALSASAGRYYYSTNPVVTHYDDRDGSLVSRSVSYMTNCCLGGAPSLTASAEVTYFTYRGWIASCGVQGVAMRYVDPSPIRRTERVAKQASVSTEIYRSFILQHRLSDAVTVDASLSRWFNLGRSRLSATLSVRNLLGNRGIEYGGYEQSRIRNYQSGANRVYLPMDDVVMYSYPRTFYAVISWKL